ncbi:hypothetical protein PAXRUDRAFT_16778 [Paxillus rubicundulus Ve08.2h10]|uniref:Arrestin C-terminal-like domain-containing protein n=1 Tax=Paxillus rubicundulus Ve08.2h10 TaxID=930991 RepID=A0A0D0CT94_9AGAM|nr:hypothetical protein PAXRUDRAFT_16778 [Paxillus rubicundulus Ve08.2h10]
MESLSSLEATRQQKLSSTSEPRPYAAAGGKWKTFIIASRFSSNSRSISYPRSSLAGEPSTSTSTSTAQGDISGGNDDIVTQLCVTIPGLATPSHALEPITVTHRVRWSIVMSNLDGHTSELRSATRRLLLEGPGAPADEEQVVELPSYPAHVRDRVAKMYLPDSATTRAMNPWVASGVSPTFASESQAQSGTWAPSGATSLLMPDPVSSHFPHVPRSGVGTPLDGVNSEPLLSLSSPGLSRPRTNTSRHSHSPTHSEPPTQPPSRSESRPLSGGVSRAVQTGTSRSLRYPCLPSQVLTNAPSTTAKRAGWLPSRSNSHSNLSSITDLSHSHRSHSYGHGLSHAHAHPPQTATGLYTPPAGADAAPAPENALWHRAFTEVPDYDVVSRRFIGGVTPLTSMRGLPSYEEPCEYAE